MAEAVFVGTVTRVENTVAKSRNGRGHIVGQVAYVQVDEAFKGVREPQLIFRSYGTSCDVRYEEGQRRLFYALYNKARKAWSIGGCDRSALLEYAAGDLLYLRGLPASAQKTRIAGDIKTQEQKPLMGVKVKLIGESKTHEVFTDKNGVYEAYDLPPGKYVIEPEIPLNLKLSFTSISFGDGRGRLSLELKDKSCAGIDFYLTENTMISGRVLSPDGQPMRDVCVRLLQKDKPKDGSFLLDCTAPDGRFKIDEIVLGEYYLVANDDGVISSNEPFPLTYYPGVFEKEKATILNIASGDKLQDFDIHIPSQRPTRTVEGRLLFSDGRPAEGETVEFTADEKSGRVSDVARAKADAEGRFKLSVLEGSKGTLHGYLYTVERDTPNCPQVDKLVKAYKDVETNRVQLEITRDHQDIELVFTVPFCAKKKEEINGAQ
jgi:5-hydroxyisourate hydrolase-like protein (transthyretin family)